MRASISPSIKAKLSAKLSAKKAKHAQELLAMYEGHLENTKI